jgi:site-specific recombinase XerD
MHRNVKLYRVPVSVFVLSISKASIANMLASEGDEIRALRRLQRETPHKSPYVFVSERGSPMTRLGFHHLVQRLGKAAGMTFNAHPHMLRHACGFKLANDGHDTRSLQHYMGHASISNTVIYTAMSADRFRDFWKD